jgi:hypothetical protein
MWIATASIWQPVHAAKNESSHARPIGAAPFVTAGLTSLARLPYGWMFAFHAAAAACGDMFDCPELSGSLKPRMCVAPALSALLTSVDQPLMWFASVPCEVDQESEEMK